MLPLRTVLIGVGLPFVLLVAQQPRRTGTDWPTYNHDLGGSRYSPLKQITAANVAKLKLAWQYKLGPNQPGGGITGGSEFTPLVVNGVMYVGLAKSLVALEPEDRQGALALRRNNGRSIAARCFLLAR